MERRNSIRSTWGAIKIYKSVLIKLVFIVGTSKDSNVQKSLEKEVQAHNDIQFHLVNTDPVKPDIG